MRGIRLVQRVLVGHVHRGDVLDLEDRVVRAVHAHGRRLGAHALQAGQREQRAVHVVGVLGRVADERPGLARVHRVHVGRGEVDDQLLDQRISSSRVYVCYGVEARILGLDVDLAVGAQVVPQPLEVERRRCWPGRRRRWSCRVGPGIFSMQHASCPRPPASSAASRRRSSRRPSPPRRASAPARVRRCTRCTAGCVARGEHHGPHRAPARTSFQKSGVIVNMSSS